MSNDRPATPVPVLPVPVLPYAEPEPGLGPGRPRLLALLAYLFILGFGLLLVYGLTRGAAERLVRGDEWMSLWTLPVFGPVAVLFTWSGLRLVHCWYEDWTGRPIRPDFSRLAAGARALLRRRRGG